jgi:hypothetical protein
MQLKQLVLLHPLQLTSYLKQEEQLVFAAEARKKPGAQIEQFTLVVHTEQLPI